MKRPANHYDLLKSIDAVAQDAHALWRRAENTKLEVARYFAVSEELMMEHGIFVEKIDAPNRG